MSAPPLIFVLALLAAVPAAAQTSQAPPAPMWLAPTPLTPSAAHERLAFLEGTWTIDGFDPAADYRETCGWLGAGRRHMVCRARWTTVSGPREALSVFSYRATDGVYVYQGFRASGALQMLEGVASADGRLFEFRGEEGSGAAVTLTRVTIEISPEGSMRFTEQTKQSDAPWSPDTVVTYIRRPDGARSF